MDIEHGKFYIGADRKTGDHLLYDSSDLTTHGVIVGMTGSGKTGLGIGLIEEALLGGIPCLVIDAKGDMGNLLLDFPELRPEDFRPWIDEAAASKEGVSADEKAASTAELWREGLTKAGITPDRMASLRAGTEMTIYTPGSAAGVPLNVLGSLAAPRLDWETEAEVIRDEIEGFVSSVLALAGVTADPVSSPEHILLATIIETWWREGKDFDLATLVGQIPKPPMRKLGVFEVDTFFPEKERMALAMKLNGLLASPSFASWIEGEPIEVENLLAAKGKTPAAIIYLAHLSDAERQFLVTLLLSKLVTWFRGLAGTSDLRALVYMDEAFGFAPPTAEPPSKKPILTILKQARAFGVGMVLSTQNPVDLDYKAMSNAGTWLVGRLQTENDKKRILEALDSAAGGVDVAVYDKLISSLEKRQFLLHTTKGPGPSVFDTRWAMSYLAGPLTRDQVSMLMDGRRAQPTEETRESPETSAVPEPTTNDTSVPVMPELAAGIPAVYLDPATPWARSVGADPTGTRYKSVAAATVHLLYDDTTAGVSHQEAYEAVIHPLGGIVGPETVHAVDHDPRDFLAAPLAGLEFEISTAPIDSKGFWSGLESDLKAYLAASQKVKVFKNTDLRLYSRVGETEDDFIARAREAAEGAGDVALAKLKDSYATKIDRVRDSISKAENRVSDLQADATSRQSDELLSGAGDLLGAFLGGRKRSNPLGQAARRRAASQKAQTRAESASEALADEQRELVELEDELAVKMTEISDQAEAKASQIETIEIPLEKTDIRVVELKLVWVPVR
jgi:hypothetical protein